VKRRYIQITALSIAAILYIFAPWEVVAGVSISRLAPSQIELHFAHVLGCHWRGTRIKRVCTLQQTGGSLEINLDQRGRNLLTVELIALVIARSGTQIDEARSRNVTTRVVDYFVPNWREGPRWVAIALDKSRYESGLSATTVGDLRIEVQPLQPADLEDTFAEITIAGRI